MSDLLPVEPAALPAEQDPVEYMALALNRAKGWLSEATRIEDVRNAFAALLDIAEVAARVSRFLVESPYYQGEKIDGAFDLERALAALGEAVQ